MDTKPVVVVQPRRQVIRYMESWYDTNTRRLHTSLGNMSPAECELQLKKGTLKC